MKKLFGLVIMLFVIYSSIQILFSFLGTGHSIDYEISSDNYIANIHEEYRTNAKIDKDKYILNINVNDVNFDVVVSKNFDRSSEIIKDIKYYEDDNYKCILLKYRNDAIINDILCNNGEYNLNYHSIKEKNQSLIDFANSLSEFGYDSKKWYDNTERMEKDSEGVSLYTNNLNVDHYIGIVYNDLLFRINKIDQITPVILDRKSQSEYAFAGEKLLVITNSDKAKYHVYSYTSSKNYSIDSDIYIGNLFIIGSYDNSVYLFDQDKKIEYEVDLENKTMLQVGDANTNIKYYQNGILKHDKLENIDIAKLNFENRYESDYENPLFAKTIKIGDKTGYYYYFKRVHNKYEVYRSSIDNKDALTYLFDTTNIETVKFYNDFIYYMDGNLLKYYSDDTGTRTLVVLNSLSSIKYSVHIK